jgi:DNA-binding transcriptional LysR family regulator
MRIRSNSQISAAELTLGVHTEDPAHSIASLLAQASPTGTHITITAFNSAAEIERQLRSGELDLAVIEEPAENWPTVAVISDLYPSVLHLLYKPATEPISIYQILAESKI